MLHYRYKVVSYYGTIDLDTDRVLGCSPELLYPQVLFHPFEEEFHTPSVAVKHGYQQRRGLDIVGKEDVSGVVIGIQNNRLTLMTKKTVDRITVPLCDGALRILKKYEGQSTIDGHVFVVPSNQRMNDFIKEAAKEAGLDRPFIDTYFVGTERKDVQNPLYEVISCHDARRTFESVSLALNISNEVVMKATGHSSYKTIQP